MKQVTQEEYNQLQESSRMLGMIASYVQGFCRNENDTTLVCVLRLLQEYHEAKADQVYNKLEELLEKP